MVYVVTLEERWITGIPGELFICGVHKSKPSKGRIKGYSKDYEVDPGCFDISDDLSLEK